MTRSMTGYASREGGIEGWRWSWELRSVNGRGLDLRLRLSDQIDGLEAPLRAALQGAVARGNVTLGLKLSREEAVASGALNHTALAQVLGLLKEVETAAGSAGVALRETGAAEILAIRGVMEHQAPEDDPEALRTALLAEVEPLIAAFNAARAAEGAALEALLRGQIDRIDELTAAARALLERRSAHVAEAFRAAVAKILDTAEGIDEQRIAQELAVLGIKADITEELDRLGAHVAAARTLLAEAGPKGRKLDFLTQEFNREANTLCSKAQFAELTAIGLDLKHVIDQMREQVQNVE